MVTAVGDQAQKELRNFFFIGKISRFLELFAFFVPNLDRTIVRSPLTDTDSRSPLRKHLLLTTRSALIHLCVFAFLFCLSELPYPKFRGANQGLSRTSDVRLLEKLDPPSGSIHFNVKTR